MNGYVTQFYLQTTENKDRIIERFQSTFQIKEKQY